MKTLVSKYSAISWNVEEVSKVSYWVLIVASIALYASSIANLAI